MPSRVDAIFAFAVGYLLGAIPFGLILTRAAGAGDVREIGSGSIGATNVLRTGRKGIAAATVLLDMAKGLVAVLLAWRLWPEVAGFAALGAVLGHCFPVWLRFRGGKGVATTFGAVLGLAWPVAAVYAAVWLGMLALTRISSVAGMSAVIAAPIAALVLARPELAPVLAALAALVLWLHRGNIARLRAGTEAKVGARP